MRDDEDFSSPRVLEIVEPFITMTFVLAAILGRRPAEIPAATADSYSRFLTEVEVKHGPSPTGALLYSLNSRAYLRQPENDSFLTPGAIAACTLTGHHSELRDRLGDMARAGVTDVAILRGRLYRWSEGRDMDDLVRLIDAVSRLTPPRPGVTQPAVGTPAEHRSSRQA
jgi:hypothetical protein